MKRTGRKVYLSGEVSLDTADAFTGPDAERAVTYFQNILTDERKGYAYKVTFASTIPSVAIFPGPFNIPYVIQSFSARDLRRMTKEQLENSTGANFPQTGVGAGGDNRTIGVVGQYDKNGDPVNIGYQTNYVIKGDAMVTQSLSLAVETFNNGQTGSRASYYIELDEYEVTDNEEILLLLNERAQNAGDPVGA